MINFEDLIVTLRIISPTSNLALAVGIKAALDCNTILKHSIKSVL